MNKNISISCLSCRNELFLNKCSLRTVSHLDTCSDCLAYKNSMAKKASIAADLMPENRAFRPNWEKLRTEIAFAESRQASIVSADKKKSVWLQFVGNLALNFVVFFFIVIGLWFSPPGEDALITQQKSIVKTTVSKFVRFAKIVQENSR